MSDDGDPDNPEDSKPVSDVLAAVTAAALAFLAAVLFALVCVGCAATVTRQDATQSATYGHLLEVETITTATGANLAGVPTATTTRRREAWTDAKADTSASGRTGASVAPDAAALAPIAKAAADVTGLGGILGAVGGLGGVAGMAVGAIRHLAANKAGAALRCVTSYADDLETAPDDAAVMSAKAKARAAADAAGVHRTIQRARGKA